MADQLPTEIDSVTTFSKISGTLTSSSVMTCNANPSKIASAMWYSDISFNINNRELTITDDKLHNIFKNITGGWGFDLYLKICELLTNHKKLRDDFTNENIALRSEIENLKNINKNLEQQITLILSLLNV